MKTKSKPIAYEKHVYTMIQRHDVNLEKINYAHIISLKKDVGKTQRKWTLHIIMLRCDEKQEQNNYTQHNTQTCT